MTSKYYSEGWRRRRSKQGSDRGKARRALWWKVYRARMDEGLEPCRRCGTREDLTFDHIIPFAEGGRLRFDNATILCQACNRWKLDKPWRAKSLEQEERDAPPERRWRDLQNERQQTEPVLVRFLDGPHAGLREEPFLGTLPPQLVEEKDGRPVFYEFKAVSRREGDQAIATYRLAAEADRP